MASILMSVMDTNEMKCSMNDILMNEITDCVNQSDRVPPSRD